MKKVKSRILIGVLMAMFTLIGFNLSLLSYGWMQLKGQLKVVGGAIPIDDYLENPENPDSLKAKIRLIKEVKRFAIDSLGLRDSDTYTSIYDQKGKPILWNVSACKPFSFEEKKWGFPVIGEFSYKGFFNYNKAVALRDDLKIEGWDVKLRTVGGWSTLGWFNDPILSNMLRRSEGRIAELIIHELTHATLFVKGNSTMNENLATLVGELGARYFIKERFGEDSEELVSYENQEADYLKFSAFMLASADRLDSLYSSFEADLPVSKKLAKKNNMIRDIVSGIVNIGLAEPNRYSRIFKDVLPNNAYFSSYRRYRSRQGEFTKEFKNEFGGNMELYLSHLKMKYPL